MASIDLSDFTQADRDHLVHFILKFVKNWELAEDFAQATLLKALTSNFEGRCSRMTWLCNIAYSLMCIYWRRDAKREQASVEISALEAQPLIPHNNCTLRLFWSTKQKEAREFNLRFRG